MIEGSPKNQRSHTYAKSVSYEGSRTEPTLGEIRIIGDRKTGRVTDVHTDGHPDRNQDRQTDRQIDSQT